MSIEARRDVFQAIADPNRRQILQLVASKSLNINEIGENFTISRPAISQHVKILTECGLVEIRQRGRERFCVARLEKLGEVSDWLAPYRSFWTGKLDALEQHLATPKKKNKKLTYKK